MKRLELALAVLVAAFLGATRLEAALFTVSVDTTPLAGVSGYVALDFTAGIAGAAGNSAIISGFATNATLQSSSSSGSVSGTLVPGPLTLSDTQVFNEWLQQVTFGTSMSFLLDLGPNVVTVAIPDEFSFFLLDSSLLGFPTSDPTGANALFAIDLNGGGVATTSVFTSSSAIAIVQPVTTQVPEPGSLAMLATTAPLLLLWRRRKIANGPCKAR